MMKNTINEVKRQTGRKQGATDVRAKGLISLICEEFLENKKKKT